MSLPASENNFSQLTSNDQYPETVQTNHCDINKQNWKCLILTLLTFVCLMFVLLCCFVTFTQTDVDPANNFLLFGSRFFWILVTSTVAFYALYFIECYNSLEYKTVCTGNIESIDDIKERIERMKNSEPIIWWKAICYHYIKRKKRNRYSDSYFIPKTVRKERVNSYISSSTFNFSCCGVKDVSNTLILDETVGRIIKFSFSKGFAFSNVTSAIEFEEQRSTFFRELRRYDEYMDIHEGLDLTDSEAFQEELFAFNSSDKRPWFTDPFYYWLSACCLLSWPFRLILYVNTVPVHYKITKVFGMNHHIVSDSTHELAMLRFYDSYGFMASENDDASLWSDGATIRNRSADDIDRVNLELAPSYSEALLLLDDQCANIYKVDSKNLSKTRFTYSTIATETRNSYRNSFSSFFGGVHRSTDEISSNSLDELDEGKLPTYEEALLFPLVENYNTSSNLHETRMDTSLNENSPVDRPSTNAQYETRLPIPRAFLSIETSL